MAATSSVFAEGIFPYQWFVADHRGDDVFRSEATEWSVIYRRRCAQLLEHQKLQHSRKGAGAMNAVADGLSGWTAVKVVDLNFRRPPHDARKEAKLLAKIEHPSVVPLLTAIYRSPSLYMHLPLYPLRLTDLLDSPSFTPSHPNFVDLARSFLQQLAQALSHLHSQGVAHRDVATNNLVLAQSGRLVLVDFGTAWDPEQPGSECADRLEFELGTMPFRAPELIFGSRHYSPPALDLWALGAVAASFFTALAPRSSQQYFNDADPSPASPKPTLQPPVTASPPPAASWYALPQPPASAVSALYDPAQAEAEKPWSLPPADSEEAERLKTLASQALEPAMRRETLFKGHLGDFALAGSIFKIRGTPTLDSWPDARYLPDFANFEFHEFPRTPLEAYLPNLPKSSSLREQAIKFIDQLLVYPSTERMSASDAAHHLFVHGALDPHQPETAGGRSLVRMMEEWVQPQLKSLTWLRDDGAG